MHLHAQVAGSDFLEMEKAALLVRNGSSVEDTVATLLRDVEQRFAMAGLLDATPQQRSGLKVSLSWRIPSVMVATTQTTQQRKNAMTSDSYSFFRRSPRLFFCLFVFLFFFRNFKSGSKLRYSGDIMLSQGMLRLERKRPCCTTKQRKEKRNRICTLPTTVICQGSYQSVTSILQCCATYICPIYVVYICRFCDLDTRGDCSQAGSFMVCVGVGAGSESSARERQQAAVHHRTAMAPACVGP